MQAAVDEVQDGDAVDFKPDLGFVASNTARNPIRGVMLKFLAQKDCITLAGGRPIPSVFPSICGEPADETLMNYGPNLAKGSPKAIEWAKEFTLAQHAIPRGWEKHDLIMTPGNTNSITMSMLLCTDAGETVLCEEFTYPGLMAAAKPLGRKVRGVDMDEHGISPSGLRTACADLAAEGRPARLLYLVPTGQNPTAITMPEHRRREIYKVAREHRLLILEDDPYYFLSLGGPDATSSDDMPGLTLDMVPKSFLALDTDGRVIRLDSCSKVLAPGFRLGWMTAPKSIVEKISIMGEVLTWALSGFTQEAFLRCQRDLGREGLHRHLQKVQWAYRQRRDWCVKAFEHHLSGLAVWQVPCEGMFLWLEVVGCEDAGRLAEPMIEEFGVALVPGASFLPEAFSKPCSKFRVSFTQVTEDSAMEAARRMAAAFKDDDFLRRHGLSRSAEPNGNEPASKARKVSST